MITSLIKGVKISGILSAVPTNKVDNNIYKSEFGEDAVRKTIEYTGVKTTYHSIENQIASDLAYVAGKNLLKEKNVKPEEIGVMLFVSSHHDYISPATAFVLQKRLEIPTNSVVFDINLGCSGFVYGLYVGASLLKTSTAKKALILLGDSSARVVSPKDTSCLLFGDSGAAVLLEKTDAEEVMDFGLKSDGNRFDDIYIPAGGFRHRRCSYEMKEEADGRVRSAFHSHMKGTNVFAFSVTDVPNTAREFMSDRGITAENIDNLFMHQPNLYIIKNVIRKLNFPEDKVPLTIDRYGNTSGVSIPITICDSYGTNDDGKKKILLLGFGVGLSWGISCLTIDTKDVFPIVFSDEYFEDGLLTD